MNRIKTKPGRNPMNSACIKKLKLIGAACGVVLLLHPGDGQARISKKLANRMADDALEVYNYGYEGGVCDPKQTNLQPESRLYALIQLFFVYCDLGVSDSKSGKRQDPANIKEAVLKSIELMNRNERKQQQK
jgi:hypothetical protein